MASTGVQSGLLTIFVQHTSASLVIQENADPDVVLDLADFFELLRPKMTRDTATLQKDPDDMPAHFAPRSRRRRFRSP